VRDRGTVLVEETPRRGDLRRTKAARAVGVHANHRQRAAVAPEHQEHRAAAAAAHDERRKRLVAELQVAQQLGVVTLVLATLARRRSAVHEGAHRPVAGAGDRGEHVGGIAERARRMLLVVCGELRVAMCDGPNGHSGSRRLG
jgi:maltooligosyltrehalose synthase